jgi:hypothetical protein
MPFHLGKPTIFQKGYGGGVAQQETRQDKTVSLDQIESETSG